MKDQIVDLPGALQQRVGARRGGARNRLGTAATISATFTQASAEFMHFTHAMFDSLAIDRRYQREEIRPQVGRIIASLRAGNRIADPITVVRRRFAEVGQKNGLFWIVDGQQRMWAALECGVGLDAICYDVASLEEERALFILLNTRTAVHANTYINAHAGVTATFLRQVNEKGHAAEDRFCFKSGGDQKRFSVATVATSLNLLYSGTTGGSIAGALAGLDAKMRDNLAPALAFVTLAALLFPDTNPGYEVLHALAISCAEKWDGRKPSQPNAASIAKMKRINWTAISAGNSHDRRTLISQRILKAWS